MPKPFIVKETIPDEPIIARGIPEHHDFVPENPDSYVVTFVRGAFKRYTVRDILTLDAAMAQADAFDREFGAFGRRSIVHAVKGSRSYLVVRKRKLHHAHL